MHKELKNCGFKDARIQEIRNCHSSMVWKLTKLPAFVLNKHLNLLKMYLFVFNIYFFFYCQLEHAKFEIFYGLLSLLGSFLLTHKLKSKNSLTLNTHTHSQKSKTTTLCLVRNPRCRTNDFWNGININQQRTTNTHS